jgi:predicted Zn-dependent peptidase
VLCDNLVKAAGTFQDEEIKRAKAQFRAQNVMALESTFRRAEKLAQNIIKFNRIIPLEETLAKIDAVDQSRMDELAHKIFSTTPTFAAVGPIGQVEDFDKIAGRLAA